jgi:hypothetical protein
MNTKPPNAQPWPPSPTPRSPICVRSRFIKSSRHATVCRRSLRSLCSLRSFVPLLRPGTLNPQSLAPWLRSSLPSLSHPARSSARQSPQTSKISVTKRSKTAPKRSKTIPKTSTMAPKRSKNRPKRSRNTPLFLCSHPHITNIQYAFPDEPLPMVVGGGCPFPSGVTRIRT